MCADTLGICDFEIAFTSGCCVLNQCTFARGKMEEAIERDNGDLFQSGFDGELIMSFSFSYNDTVVGRETFPHWTNSMEWK